MLRHYFNKNKYYLKKPRRFAHAEAHLSSGSAARSAPHFYSCHENAHSVVSFHLQAINFAFIQLAAKLVHRQTFD